MGNPGDVTVKRNRLHIFSEGVSAVFDLPTGGRIQRVVAIQLVDEKTAEGHDPYRIPLPELLHTLGFSADLQEAALETLNCPPCELELQAQVVRLRVL